MKFKDFAKTEAMRAVELEPKFCDLVHSLSEEWNEKKGYVTCEFSTDKENLHEKMMFLFLKSQLLEHEGIWRILPCDTCYGFHDDKFYHVEIVRVHN
jgi:hypothetical protein